LVADGKIGKSWQAIEPASLEQVDGKCMSGLLARSGHALVALRPFALSGQT